MSRTSAPIKKFGDWETKNNNTVYLAETDGFVCANQTIHSDIVGYSDSNNPPTTIRRRMYTDSATDVPGLTMPVKKGDYWKITGANFIYWIPLK